MFKMFEIIFVNFEPTNSSSEIRQKNPNYKNVDKAEINFSNFQALKISHIKLHHEKTAEYCLFIKFKFISYLGSVHVIT